MCESTIFVNKITGLLWGVETFIPHSVLGWNPTEVAFPAIVLQLWTPAPQCNHTLAMNGCVACSFWYSNKQCNQQDLYNAHQRYYLSRKVMFNKHVLRLLAVISLAPAPRVVRCPSITLILHIEHAEHQPDIVGLTTVWNIRVTCCMCY